MVLHSKTMIFLRFPVKHCLCKSTILRHSYRGLGTLFSVCESLGADRFSLEFNRFRSIRTAFPATWTGFGASGPLFLQRGPVSEHPDRFSCNVDRFRSIRTAFPRSLTGLGASGPLFFEVKPVSEHPDRFFCTMDRFRGIRTRVIISEYYI
jgi:hypothetical protein